MSANDTGLVWKHRIPRGLLIDDRVAWLVEHCRNKRVLHLGCTDAGMTSERLESQGLLHFELARSCAALAGIDVDAQGIERLRRLNAGAVWVADVAAAPADVVAAIKRSIGSCELILCGEVLEHVLDAGRFLAGLRVVAAAFDAELVLTVPNAYSLRGMLAAFAGTELVHPDHKCYYSWKTIDVLLREVGFRPSDTHWYSNVEASHSRIKRLIKRMVHRLLLRRRPQLAEGLIVTARVV